MASIQKKGLWIGGDILGTSYNGELFSNVNNIKTAGFHDLFIWSGLNTNKDAPKETKYYLQIGNANCVYYDIASDTVTWNGDDQNVKTLVENVNAILLNHTPVGTIENIHIMLGGGSYYDGGTLHNNQTFVNLEALIYPSGNTSNAPQTGEGSVIHRMFQTLQRNLPAITGVQYDDEYQRIAKVNNAFSEMLLSTPFNYKLSYIPYDLNKISFWEDCVEKFKDQLYGLYIQNYATSFSDWVSAMTSVDKNIDNIIRPVFKVKSSLDSAGNCPSQIKEGMSAYKNYTGAGIWIYDHFRKHQLEKNTSICSKTIGAADYAKAIEIP
jgi:hypothetical protein